MAQAGALPAAAGPVAPPQPVAVTVATARVTADLPLTFLANTRFILDNLPFLPWDVERTADGTLVRFRLGHHDAMASFVDRIDFDFFINLSDTGPPLPTRLPITISRVSAHVPCLARRASTPAPL